MHQLISLLCGLVLLVTIGWLTAPTRGEPPMSQPVHKEFGLDKREIWTDSKVKGSPEPPNPYQLVPAYPNLTFNEPLEIVPVPGTTLWAVGERRGQNLYL